MNFHGDDEMHRMRAPTRPLGWVMAMALTMAAGCTHLVPQLVAGPFPSGDPALMERAISVAARRGYHAESVDRTDGSFMVSARADPRLVVTFEVQCTSDGWIVVTPHGDRVVENDRGFLLRGRLYDEYLAFVNAMQRDVAQMTERAATDRGSE